MRAIPTYIINLDYRTLRKEHILKEFDGRDEFRAVIVNAIEHQEGAVGLWKTICYILNHLVDNKAEYIILCEDDHQFTEAYCKEDLFNYIKEAQEKNADMLSGGVSGFSNALQVSGYFYWVERFSGLQFTIIFRKFFETILAADFARGNAADYKMCALTENKFFIYPFISDQKDFGYSDATPKNNSKESVNELFTEAKTKIKLIQDVSSFYATRVTKIPPSVGHERLINISIPTYVINLPDRKERRKNVEKQFEGKPEFDLKIIEACKHKIGAVGLWQSFRKIIKMAIKEEDDVIIICEDDHVFTANYSKERLIQSIFQAHKMGTNLLIGGIGGGFDAALMITEELWWVNSFWCSQFMVIYKRFFQQILDEPFDDKVVADGLFSKMTANKMVLYPFISIQQDFGYSDCTNKNNKNNGVIENLFSSCNQRIATLKRIYSKYGLMQY